jgi:hypothetical protein
MVLAIVLVFGLVHVSCENNNASGSDNGNDSSNNTSSSVWFCAANNNHSGVSLHLYNDGYFSLNFFPLNNTDGGENTSGTFTQDGNAITLRYYESDGGGVFGTGTISGSSLVLNTSKYGTLTFKDSL